MATTCAKIHVHSRAPKPINIHENISKIRNSEAEKGRRSSSPYWYCSETGIYRSKHPSVHLPSDPFLDVASFILSRNHGGLQSALIDSQSGFSISYPELRSLVNSMAAGLHQMGVSQGDVALILLPNSIYFPVIFLGLLSVGAVAATMNPLSTLSEIKKQSFDCNVRLAFATPDRVENLGSALGIPVIGLPESSNLDSTGANDSGSVFRKLISSDPKLAPNPRIHQQDTAAILFSSGTSGGCKAVELTHANFIAMVELFVRFEASQYEYPATANVYLDVLPMYHVYGLSLFVMGLLSLGSTVVVMRKYEVNEMVKAIDRYGVTHFPVAPPLLVALTRKAKAAKCSLKSLKQVSSGAAPVSITCIHDFVRTFPHIDFIQGYGMTESTAVGTRGFNTAKLRNYTSVGLLAPNMEARVVDWSTGGTGSSLPPTSMGELWMRGPAIMKGYLKNGEASKNAVDDDGWLHTGDIVHFDEDGYMYVHDRLKEMIKYKGFQIAPADLEAVLMSHPDIVDAAVTSYVQVHSEEVGEIPVAFVVKKEGSSTEVLSQADVIDFVAKQVAPYKKVRRVYFTKSIPKSAAGKILRKELRNLLITSKI